MDPLLLMGVRDCVLDRYDTLTNFSSSHGDHNMGIDNFSKHSRNNSCVFSNCEYYYNSCYILGNTDFSCSFATPHRVECYKIIHLLEQLQHVKNKFYFRILKTPIS